VVYVAGLLVFLGFNAFGAYLFINLFSVFIVIYLLDYFGKLLKINRHIIIFITLLYLTLPSTIFSAYKPLTSSFDTALFSLFIFYCVRLFILKNTKSFNYIWFVFLIIFLIFERQDHIYFIIIILSYFFIKHLTINKTIVHFVGLFFLIYITKHFNLFSLNYKEASIIQLISCNYLVPGDNMKLYFSNIQDYSIDDIFYSVLFKIELFINNTLDFGLRSTKILPLKIILLISYLLTIYKLVVKRLNLFFFTTAFLVLTLLLITVVLFQDFYRYYMFVIPLLLIYIFFHIKNYNFFRISQIKFLNFFCIFCIVIYHFIDFKISSRVIKSQLEIIETIKYKNLSGKNLLIWYDGELSFIIGNLNKESKIFLCNEESLLDSNIHLIPFDYIFDIDNNISHTKPFILKDYVQIEQFKNIKTYELNK
jgi:hypothetical protein